MNGLIPEICYAEDSSQCAEILDGIRKMNAQTIADQAADAALADSLAVFILIGLGILIAAGLIQKMRERTNR